MADPPPQPTFTVDGNRLTLLDTGHRRIEALIALIDGATASLRLLYYIYADDEAGRRVNAALIAAVKRGVDVALIVDGYGGSIAASRDFFKPLSEVGVDLCWFSPRWGRQFLLRNHQKLALADAETDAAKVITGGFNIEDDYLGRAPEAWKIWRDLGLLVEGPAAARAAKWFDALSRWTHHSGGKLRQLNRAVKARSEADGAVRWLVGGPTRRLSPWAQRLRADMRAASRIDIIAGYFAPSPTILRRLDRAAAKRGAEVRVVTAALSDHPNAVEAARFTYAGLLRKKVRIWEYQPSKLHTKLFVVDDAVHVGSANFDMRSLFINLELMLRIEDPAFAAHARAYVDGEIAQSEEITKALWKQRSGWWARVRQFTAYVAMAVVDPRLSRGLNGE